MADIWSQYGMSLPMGASPRDPVVGQTEWGAPVYQSPLGHQYYEPIESTSAPQQRGSVVRALADQVANQPITSTIGAVARALGEGMWGAFSAPGRALSGDPVTMGDVWDTAGMAQLGAAAMPAPRGALRSGAIREIDNFDDIYDALRASDEPAFIRWSAGPEYDMRTGAASMDYSSGQKHAGLSALEIDRDYLPDADAGMSSLLYADQNLFRTARDYSYLQGGGYGDINRPHILFGQKVGFDSDGAPSIVPSRYFGTLSSRIQDMLMDDDIPNRLSAEAMYLQGVNRMMLPRFGADPGMLPGYTNVQLKDVYDRLMEYGGSASGLFRRP